jgi:peptidoglycan/LPS O-acetylase OafA/YrhL
MAGGATLDPDSLSPDEEAGTAPGDRAFRPDVEGLRAVAILMVVLFHVGLRQAQGGNAGVDVFFVISGFVITGLLLREQRTTGGIKFLSFYARRARRILPMAILVIVTSLAATKILVGSDATLVASDSRWSSVFLADFHFGAVLPTLFTHRVVSPLEQFWSLAVEEQFYLVYPAFFAILMVGVPIGRWSKQMRLGAGLLIIAVASFALCVASSHVGQLGAYYSPFTRAWELALGGLVAVATPALRSIPTSVAAVIAWIGLVAVIGSASELSLRFAYPGAVAAIPVLGAVLVVAGGTSAPALGAERVLGLAPFRWLGRRSYSWYLWHWPFLAIAAEYSRTPLSLTTNLLLVLLALVLSAATYSLVENPIRHSRWIASRPHVSVIGAVLLIATCVGFTYLF